MSLNEPRKVPYSFRVFERGGWVWLYDESSRTFPCSMTPHVYAEPLYPVEMSEQGEEWDSFPDPGLFAVSRFKEPAIEGSEAVPLWDEDVEPGQEYDEAWSIAREEAQSNHII